MNKEIAIVPLEKFYRRTRKFAVKHGIRKIEREWGISRSSLSRISRGFKPDIENYILICEMLSKEEGK